MKRKTGCGQEPGARVSAVPEALSGLLRPGDLIVEVGGRPVEDLLDFYHRRSMDPRAPVLVRSKSDQRREIRLPEDLSGIEFESLDFRRCGNDCVFCFIHQMPPGMREELYFQDEDFRLGFMFGNYVTLALVRERDLERILSQNLSPQYVSVHATDMALRNRLLGLKKSRDILETLRRLTEGGVTVHAQAVLLPGWNDGEQLDRTLEDLAKLWPGVASLGIVPVGLTRYRENLTPLRPFDEEAALRVLDQVQSFQRRFMTRTGRRFAYPADELFLLAGRPLPDQDAYDDFPQLDNGIGMGRDFVDRVLEEIAGWTVPARSLRAAVLTGKLGGQLFRDYLAEPLSRLKGLELEIRVLENRLFGEGVTVSGLLPGAELLEAAGRDLEGLDALLLPPNTLNAAGLFLDDLSLEEMRARLPLPLLVPETGLLGPLLELASGEEGA